MTFNEYEKCFKEGQFHKFLSAEGYRFLSLRAMARPEYLRQLASSAELPIEGLKGQALFKSLYESASTISLIESEIRKIYHAERAIRKANEPLLVSELYKLASFDWGGLHQNSLEKTIINNYVKKITSFDVISKKIDEELQVSLKGYVLCSWYNHWTSIIIEDVFKDHTKVLPAVGLIKQVDFFINKIPFDLKVTYFPEGYMAEQRAAKELRPELTELKKVARSLNIDFDIHLSPGTLLEDLWKKISDHPDSKAKKCISELKSTRKTIISDAQRDSSSLIKWLYENQGERRFDASNRLFLVLIDLENNFDSWKLKRAKPLIKQKVDEYLDTLKSSVGKAISFTWEGSNYKTISDMVFVIKSA